MAVSVKGRAFTASHEAIYLYTYRDPGGVLTDGVGNTAMAGIRAPKPGGRITLDQALHEYKINLKKYNDRVLKAIKNHPLVQHEEDALTSFDLNTGAIFSGTVDDKLNQGDISAAMATLRRYIHDNGKVLNGLVKRRNDEAQMFLTGAYPNRPILLKESPMSKGRLVNAASLPWDDALQPLTIEGPLEVPPLPTRNPERGSGNFLIDLVWRPIAWFVKGFWS